MVDLPGASATFRVLTSVLAACVLIVEEAMNRGAANGATSTIFDVCLCTPGALSAVPLFVTIRYPSLMSIRSLWCLGLGIVTN